MPDILSFAEVDGAQVELLPARTVLSSYGAGAFFLEAADVNVNVNVNENTNTATATATITGDDGDGDGAPGPIVPPGP